MLCVSVIVMKDLSLHRIMWLNLSQRNANKTHHNNQMSTLGTENAHPLGINCRFFSMQSIKMF